MELNIKITGIGTKEELKKALKEVLNDLSNTDETKLENGVVWEDAILLTEIKS